jgi:hypothetical protein
VKIAIATKGRFHVLDLARELMALGHEVTFYSCMPKARAAAFGLPEANHVSVLALMTPFLIAERYAPAYLAKAASRQGMGVLDRAIAAMLRPCDVLIAMSGIFLETLKSAKRRYGATVILERGSRHIVSQDRILRSMPGGDGADPFSIPRELDGYAIADIISIPSRHVAESFVAEGVAESQLMINPYGCDLAMFPPTARKGTPERTIVEAWRALDGVRLLHVGPMGDLPLPVDSNFVHVDAVSQERLSEFYAQADVFVLASREEGLALVQAQALASGLPVVCTTRTGGADLRDLTGAGRAVIEVEPDDPVALAVALKEALATSVRQGSGPRKVVRDLTALSWRAYGARYDANLRTLPISNPTHARLVTA